MNGVHSKSVNMAIEYDEELDEYYEVLPVSVSDILFGDIKKESKKEEEEKEYCNWILSKGIYSPAIEVQIVSKMETGVYKVANTDSGPICEKQKISSDGLYMLPNSLSSTIMGEVNKFWDRSDIFKEYDLVHKRGIMLEGSPGTGKSSYITLLIEDLLKRDGLVFLINNIRDFTIYYSFLKNTLRKIEPTRPVITVIEDIDKLIINTGMEGEILDFLDGKMSTEHHLVITTTNDSSNLPDALLRPSRMDMRVVVPVPSKEARKKYFEIKGVKEEDIEKYVKESEKLSISQLKELFIGTYVLGNSFDNIIKQIKNPLAKQEYSSDFGEKTKIGF